MRIALIASEFAGTVQTGGIGTYMRNISVMLAARGHEVEVFTAGSESSFEVRADGVRLHTVRCGVRKEFADLIAPIFLKRHRAAPFDVAEGAEYMAETRTVAHAVPDLPLVIKLHTPAALISMIEGNLVPLRAKMRFVLGALRRGSLAKRFWRYDPTLDYERDNLRTASEITAPCRGIAQTLGSMWKLEPEVVSVVPYVFAAPRYLLDVPIETQTQVITYIGRLEARKGVLDLADAIPLVLREVEDARFRFVGRSLNYPGTGDDIGEMLKSRLRPVGRSVEFIDSVPYDQVHRFYATTDISVIPSIWENFPHVCLEAMAAARGVVGSNAGGMAEMIADGKSGLLVPPQNPRALAGAILTLLRDPKRRQDAGRVARAHVLKAYSADVIGPLQEASYERAIERARQNLRPWKDLSVLQSNKPAFQASTR